MVEILKHGKYYGTIRCKHCNCMFTYNRIRDVEYGLEFDDEGCRVDRKYIHCPECSLKNYLDGKEVEE